MVVSKEKIAESGEYNLSGDRYRETEQRGKRKWPMVKLGEIVLFISGYAFKSTNMTATPISTNSCAVVKIGNVGKNGTLNMDDAQFHPYSENLNRFVLCIGDIVIAMTGATVGKVALVDKPNLLLNQRVGVLRVKEIALQNYIFNLLHTSLFYDFCQREAGGGAQGNIAPDDILEYKIPLPPIEIQREIVAEIEGYQKIIDGARQVVDNWKPHIDIDPDWSLVKLGDLCEIVSDTVEPCKMNGTIKYIGLENIETNTGKIIGKIDTKYSEIKSLKNKFMESDILYGKLRPALNKVYLAQFSGICSTDIIVLRPNKKLLSKILETFLRSKHINQLIIRGISGSQLPRVSFNYLSNIQISLPPLETQHAIVAEIEAEQKAVDGCRELITLYEGKIKAVIERVWGKDSDEV